MKKIYFIQMKKLLMQIVILCLANFAYAQNQVSGKVSSTGEPLPGVNVLVKGTTVGTVSDIDGNYLINVPSPQTILIFSFIGYKFQEVIVGDKTVIDIALAEDVQSLEEVVVIGYGQVQKRDVTGAVNSLREDYFNTGVQASVGQMIQGRSPGVQIRQNSSAPGEGVSVRIRGTASINAGNDPLYVIDGQPINWYCFHTAKRNRTK